MRNPKTTRIAVTVTAALLSAATLSFPFSVLAQSATSVPAPTVQGDVAQTTPSTTPAASPVTPAVPVTSPPTAPAPVVAPAVTVSLTDGTHPARTVTTHGGTVKDMLTEANITLSDDDRVLPALATPIQPNLPVTITRVRFQLENRTSAIPFRTIFRMSREVPAGRIEHGRTGAPGVLTSTYKVGYVNEHARSFKLVSRTVTKAPVPQETLAGIRVREARALPSRGGIYNRMQCYTMTATGYSPYEGSSQGLCANGMRAGYGVVAVDPRLIRLGTKLYIEGYGYAVAGDTGGAIKGRRIDLGHTTYREANSVGRRQVRVWVLNPGR